MSFLQKRHVAPTCREELESSLRGTRAHMDQLTAAVDAIKAAKAAADVPVSSTARSSLSVQPHSASSTGRDAATPAAPAAGAGAAASEESADAGLHAAGEAEVWSAESQVMATGTIAEDEEEEEEEEEE